LSSFFFGVDTSGAIALLKFPKAHQQTIIPGFPATIIHSGFFRLWWLSATAHLKF
jgi:hypothetical protein